MCRDLRDLERARIAGCVLLVLVRKGTITSD